MDYYNNLRHNKIRKLQNLINKIPNDYKITILNSVHKNVTVIPCQTVNLNSRDQYLKNIAADQIYTFLIADKTRLPTGLLRWLDQFVLSDAEIKLAFTFARKCSQSIFDHVFQYKILTNILPTNKYLYNYQIADSNLCSKCLSEQDTVLHSLWSCTLKVPYVAKILQFLERDCNVTDIFGFKDNIGLNHILLELKKEIFYNWSEGVGEVTFCERFITKMRIIMIKEKQIMIEKDNFEHYIEKWNNFREIYDFLGPDQQIIY